MYKHETEIEIISTFQVDMQFMTTVQLVSGEIDIDMVFKPVGKSEEWRIVGLAYIDVESHKKGIRGMVLESKKSGLSLEPEMVLKSVSNAKYSS